MKVGTKVNVQKETEYSVTDAEVKEYTAQLQENLRNVQKELDEKSTSPVHVVEPPTEVGDVEKVLEEVSHEAEVGEGTGNLREGC